jgi:hypothetical protein
MERRLLCCPRMMRALTAVVLAATVGCGPQWPSHSTMVADRGFLSKTKQVNTVDVLPMHLELWTGAGSNTNADELRSVAEARVMNAVLATLAERNYAVGSVIDWEGNASGDMHVLAPADLVATITALARYGSTVEQHPGEMPIPYLPARLGETTHSDATLFVGGWAFVGAPQESTASKVAKGVAIGLMIVAAVVVIAVAVEALGGDKHEKSNVRDHRSGGDSGGDFATHGPSAASRGIHFAAEAAVEVIDAFGRTAELAAQTDWANDEALPHEGDSQMYLEMTLVDNHTGLALWHVHQQFPAGATSNDDVDRVAHTSLASLPAH